MQAAGGFDDITTTKMSDIEKIEKKKEGRRLEMVYNTTDLLDRLLDGYDRKLRPNFGGLIRLWNSYFSLLYLIQSYMYTLGFFTNTQHCQ